MQKVDPVAPVLGATEDRRDEMLHAVNDLVGRVRNAPALNQTARLTYAHAHSMVGVELTAAESDDGLSLTARATAPQTQPLVLFFVEYLAGRGFAPVDLFGGAVGWLLPNDFAFDDLPPLVVARPEMMEIVTESGFGYWARAWINGFLGATPRMSEHWQVSSVEYSQDIRGPLVLEVRCGGARSLPPKGEVRDEALANAALAGRRYVGEQPPKQVEVRLSVTQHGAQVLGDVIDAERLAHNLGLFGAEWQVDGTLRCYIVV